MSDIERAADVLRSGGLVAFPTETVYGLGVDATNAAAVRKIFAAKGRPATNPLIVHVADAVAARRWVGAWPEAATKLAARFWPGPLTLVLPKGREIVDEVTAGLGTVGLRVPGHAVALDLLRAADRPIAAPSANRSNRVSPTTAQHVREELGDRVDLVLDGGPCDVGIESTVLDLSGEIPTILRPGAITAAMMEPILGPVRTFSGAVTKDVAAASPGQQAVHYAPTTPAYRYEAAGRCGLSPEGNGLVALGNTGEFRRHGAAVTMPNDAGEYARRLYGVLRELDAMGLRALYIEMPPDRPEWAAVRDRIRRATREA